MPAERTDDQCLLVDDMCNAVKFTVERLNPHVSSELPVVESAVSMAHRMNITFGLTGELSYDYLEDDSDKPKKAKAAKPPTSSWVGARKIVKKFLVKTLKELVTEVACPDDECDEEEAENTPDTIDDNLPGCIKELIKLVETCPKLCSKANAFEQECINATSLELLDEHQNVCE